MKTFYSNILIPIDFGKETEALIHTAVEFANPGNSIIHLIHIKKPSPLLFWRYWRKNPAFDYFSSATETHHFVRILLKLLHWKNWIEDNHKDVRVCIHMRKGKDPQQLVACLADHLECELVVLPKKSKIFFFSIAGQLSAENLAKQTKCEVLSLGKGIHFSHVQKDFFSSTSLSNDFWRKSKGINSPELIERAYYAFSFN